MKCGKTNSRLADLLLDPVSAPAKLRQHVEGCADCREELAELRSSMSLLDHWTVPEASPYFDSKVMATLRAEPAVRPGILERIRARFLYGSSLRMQPLLAGALGLVIVVGGGTYADLAWQSMQTQESATIRDLKSFDGNEQVFQQLDSVDQGSGDTVPGAVEPPSND